MIDGRSFDTHPFDPAGPALSADIPVMAGCTDTETTYYLRSDPRNFTLDMPEVRRRLTRFLQVGAEAAGRIIEAYRAEYPDIPPSGVLVRITSDHVLKRNTYRIGTLRAAQGRAPVHAYLFSRRTPVEGGRLGAPHTSEVPFVFGTAPAAAAHVGTGGGRADGAG